MPQSDGSPARFTAEDASSAASSASSADNTGAAKSKTRGAAAAAVAAKKAVDFPDEELVALLRQPPKTTLILRTKGNFQSFFRGISQQRMQTLLQQAYADIETESDRQQKVNKRMGLLEGCFGQ